MAAHLGALVEQLGDTLDAMVDADPADLVDAELADVLVGLMHETTRLEAVTVGVADRVDASGVWRADGSRSCAAWLSRAADRETAECAAIVARARSLRRMPQVTAAHRAGGLSTRQVDALRRAEESAPDAFADDEAQLIGWAGELDAAGFRKVVDYWRQCAAPEDTDDAAERRHRRRALRLTKGLHGTGLLDVEFEPLGYATFAESLRRIEQDLWVEDWADARSRLGDAARKNDLVRSDAQRRYDALIEMAARAASAPPGAVRPRPLITVHVDHDTLAGRICELADGTVLSPGQVAPLLTVADVERAVFDPAGRVIDLGRRRRLFTGGARRAVEIEHPTCVHDTCTVPSEQCDIHHIHPWEAGGPTTPTNGEPRCPAHHPGRRRPNRPRGGSGPGDTDGDDSDSPAR